MSLTAEIAATRTIDRPAAASDAGGLLAGYAGPVRGTWVEGEVALAWSGSAEVGLFDDLIVIVDGRLDNRSDLRSRYGIALDESLAGVIARIWRRSGWAMVDALVGDIAGIAVEREGLQLVAFRDLCGGRPLHVTRDRAAWKAATEWYPLVSEQISPSPSQVWFASAFVGHSIEPSATPYAGVDVVLPGHVATPIGLRWKQTRHAHWHVPKLRNRQPVAYAEQFRAIFDEALRCRVSDAEAVGVALSGGLDSTSVMASLAHVKPDCTCAAISIPMREPEGDERAFQATVAERAGAELHWVDIDGRGPFGSSGPSEVFTRCGAPPLVINWFLGDAMAEVAARADIEVVLDGEDGDGSVGGSFAFLADLLITGRWVRWWQEARAIRVGQIASGRDLIQHSLYLLAPPALRRAYIRRAGFSIAPEVLAEPLRRELDLQERILASPLHPPWAPGRTFRRAQGSVGMAEQMAPVFTAISEPWRRRGITLSHPWSDRRLMSFCMGLPYEHICAGAVSKKVLRQAMNCRLPREIVRRRDKASLAEASRRRAYGSERPYVLEGLRIARRMPDWFAAEAVQSVEYDFRAGRGEAEALRVAMFALWLQWLDEESHSDRRLAMPAGLAQC